MEENNLYQKGMDSIISGSNFFSSPFITFGQSTLPEIKKLCNSNPDELKDIKNIDLNDFLSSFYSCTNLFIETISQLFAEIIRRKTTRDDIRSETSDALTKAIRKESFQKIDAVLIKYSSLMEQLGVQLENIDTIKSSVNGAIDGGVLNYSATGGTRGGAVAGALIGAATAELEKIELRKKLLKSSIEGIGEFTDILPIISSKLMDQYSTYIFGSNINFDDRDQEIKRGNQILKDISKHTQNILDQLVLYNETVTDIESNIHTKDKMTKKSESLKGPTGIIKSIFGFGLMKKMLSQGNPVKFFTNPIQAFKDFGNNMINSIPGYNFIVEKKIRDSEIAESDLAVSNAMDQIKNNNFPKLQNSLSGIEESIQVLTNYQKESTDLSKVFN